MKRSKFKLFQSFVALLLCVSMFVGTTFAWFTDSVTSGGNIIKSGKLDVEMYWADGTQDPASAEWKDASTGAIFDYSLWEPGYTEVRHIKIANEGNLALQYQLQIVANGEVSKLSDVIDVYYIDPAEQIADRSELSEEYKLNNLTAALSDMATTANGSLSAGENVTLTIALKMCEDAGNEYQNLSIGSDFSIVLLATQFAEEGDSFGADYDQGASFEFPEVTLDEGVTVPVEVDEDNRLAKDVAISGNRAKAIIPAGVLLEEGVTELTMLITSLNDSEANIQLGENDDLRSLDVHIDGVSPDNEVPMEIQLFNVAPTGLNEGNFNLYHVENGQTNAMEKVAENADLTKHNQYKYNPVEGTTALNIATFSEFDMVADTENAWKGNFDYSWYTNAVAPVDGESASVYVIANADQLAAFGAVVGGMAEGIEQDSFSGKTVKLLSDINLGDDEEHNKSDIIFYPIGYNSSDGKYEKTGVAVTTGFYNFCGTFDGQGHTVSNFYQNTWEMKGDNTYYDLTLQYFRDGMGLFGRVYGGTIKNLSVDNFKSDGEYTTTGVIAAYADGATFENIAITNCNPRVYNIGNGGIVGCVGWYAKDEGMKTTFKNITVDNSNKISALWGSYDVACGGIVGQYYPTSGQTSANKPANGGVSFENCHISAQMDVYNDVCGNYQYYAYRYAGMLIGSVRENETIDGHEYPKMDGITAKDCTVHFGTWNDYYYCEIIDNTTASYTHDYQMSRLTEIKAIDGTTITYLDGTTGTVPASGRANYVIVDYSKGHGTENATCYHFKDGKVWNHEDGGKETVNDVEVLKEDKQHLYLEFNNLVTGYGWGVTTKVVNDVDGVEILDRKVADSVVKFEVQESLPEFYSGKTVNVGDLFKEKSGIEYPIDGNNVNVFVSPIGEDSTVAVEYTADTKDWTQGTLKFTGSGSADVIITDYKYCKETKLTISINTVDKFSAVFDSDPKTAGVQTPFLYRVGNANDVKLSSLFAELPDVTINSANVTVEVKAMEGSNVSGEVTLNTSEWKNSTIDFNGTGPVKVTIAGDSANAVELMLEVVDAYNVTQYSELKDQTSVLLNKIEMSSGGSYRLVGNASARKTLYGNGFDFDITKGAYQAVQYDYMSYVVYLENANLNNVKIRGAVYNQYGATKADNYNRAAVMTSGNVTITNSHISNCASPIRNGGNLELINVTLKGGIYANLDMRNGHLTLDNVTTVNQIGLNDQYIGDNGEKTEVAGLGIVVFQEGGTEDFSITIRNKLEQYNYLSEAQAKTYITDTSAKLVTSEIFASKFNEYQYNDGTTKWVNAGIISMNNLFEGSKDIHDERNDKMGYTGKGEQISLAGKSRNCYVYSFKPTTIDSGDTDKMYGQYAVEPAYVFDYKNKNYVGKTEGSNDYCYEDNGTIYISMDEGETFNWDTSILNVAKNGQNISYSVTMDEVDYTGKSITFDKEGDYTVGYSYTDSNNYRLNENGEISTYSVEYTKEVHINVAVVKASAKHAVFSFGANGTAYKAKTVMIGDKTYVMPDVTATESGKIGSKKVDGVTVYYPIVEMYTSDGTTAHKSSWYACFPIFKDAVQIIDYADKGTGDPISYNQKTVTKVAQIPATLKATDPAKAFLYSMNATNYPPPEDPTAVNGAVCYTCNRNGLDSSNTRKEESTVAEYTYRDNADTVYHYYIGYHCAEQTSGSGTCLAAGTMITLADGSKRAVEDLRKGDSVMSYDHLTGKVTSSDVIIVVKTAADSYYKNTFVFDDGTELVTINEHGIYDLTLRKYVNIDHENGAEFIGHKFAAIDSNGKVSKKKLVAVETVVESGYKYDIVTDETLNYVAEDTLSVTHVLVDVINSFDFTFGMRYSKLKMKADIEKYGLYTYDEWAEHCDISVFEEYNIPVMKVGISKGLYTKDYIIGLINTYVLDESVQIIE